MFGWGDDTIITPSLYTKINSAKTNKLKIVQDEILPTLSTLLSSNEESLSLFKQSNETISYDFSDTTLIIKTIDCTPTNDYFVINKHNGNISSHVVSSKIEITSPLFSKYFEEFVLTSNQ